MAPAHDIAVLVGSLRKDSFNRKVALALAALAPPSLALEIVPIGELPLYDADLEAEGSPPAWTTFRERIARAAGVFFVTPEFNRSVPGALKNAIDVGSRPAGKGVWSGKPGAVVSVTTGQLGAFGANHHLRQSLVFLNVLTMQQPEAYIGNAASLFDATGAIAVEPTRALFAKIITAYAAWVERLVGPPA